MLWWKLLSMTFGDNSSLDCSNIHTFRIFDKDNDGFLTKGELCKIMKDRISKKDLEEMVEEADKSNDGLINCEGDKYKT